MQPETASLFSPLQLAAFIGIAAFILSMAVNILTIRKMTSPRPENEKLGEAVTRLTAISEHHAAAILKIEQACASCRTHQSAEVGRVHNRVDEVAAAVSRLDGKMDTLIDLNKQRRG